MRQWTLMQRMDGGEGGQGKAVSGSRSGCRVGREVGLARRSFGGTGWSGPFRTPTIWLLFSVRRVYGNMTTGSKRRGSKSFFLLSSKESLGKERVENGPAPEANRSTRNNHKG